ncbi:hypothetical protein CVD28_03495 [Bacillus sp. M6-12]|uniref:hypothetical protein n=1 Tax=Bacillus sp. M6-12 TaxID=2054166 RepID=UPI000C75F56C|nr:hypothetical protein [Bacillus sp. M6-12]PLS19493.1 hypothetical protein CVD28_03495 [Bacillus sp. M6-12]
MKTYIITGDPSCFGEGAIYVNCPESFISSFLEECGYGCQECRNYQEVESMSREQVHYFVTEHGTVFNKADYMVLHKELKGEQGT